MTRPSRATPPYLRHRIFQGWAIVVTAIVVALAIQASAKFPIPNYVVAYALFGILAVVERFSIPVTNNDSLFFETVFIVAFCFTYPINSVLWAILGYGVVLTWKYRKRGTWDKALINVGSFALSALAAHDVYFGLTSHSVFFITNVLPALSAAVAYFVVNFGSLVVSIYLLHGTTGVVEYLKGSVTVRFFAIYGLQMLIGVLLATVIITAGLSGVLLFTGLIILVAYSYRDYFRMANHFKDLSIKDELTGLFNHRWVQSWIDDHITQQQPFSLLIVDIDHFKRYNDVWGHLRGDETLRLVAHVIQSNLTDEQEVARYIGEKFLVVLPDQSLEDATERAEQIRQAIEAHEIPGTDKMPGKRFTVSLGVAAYPEMADNKKELLMMVDDALYKGKFTGRNKVSIYSSVIDELKSELVLESTEQETVNTIKVFLALLNSKDRYTYAHTERDARYVEALGRKIGLAGDQLLYLRFGAFLHDIGKVEIPQEVLAKRGPLTRDEWVIMKSHVELGVKIIESIPSLSPCIPIVRHHHERYDGAGYPMNLVGTDIPLEARILTIADSFDAMTTSRPYQRRRGMDEAFEELRLCAGKQFDPDLVEPFISVVREMGMLSNEPDEDEDLIAQP